MLSNLSGGESSLPARLYAVSKGDVAPAARGWVRFLRARSGLGSRIEWEAKETLLGDMMDFLIPFVCDAWSSSDPGPSFRAPVRTNVPALFISGTFDVRTPVSYAEEVRKGFSESVYLIIDGAVHSDPLFLSSPKIKDVMLEFMKGQPISTTSITLPRIKFSPVAPQRGN